MMPDPSTDLQWLDTANGPVAYRRSGGAASTGLALVFCPGYRSDMDGDKARVLAAAAPSLGLEVIRFDWRGHGRSPGAFETLGIGDWLEDLRAVLRHVVGERKVVLVGSSMGGWIATLAAERRDRIAGLVTIAAAPDFTEELVRPGLTAAEAATLAEGRTVWRPSRYGDGPYPYSAALLASGRAHRLLDRRVAVSAPVRLLHGLADPDVPWHLSLRLQEALAGTDVTLTLVKGGDHRLSRPADLVLLRDAVAAIARTAR